MFKFTNYVIGAGLVGLVVFGALPARAAELKLTTDSAAVKTGDQFLVNLTIDTKGLSLNAFQGQVTFPKDLLELKEVRDGNSLINLWLDRPQATTSSPVTFSGITPGGYVGQQGLILALVFQAKKTGQATIDLREVKILRNDGRGTSQAAKLSPVVITISQKLLGAGGVKLGMVDHNPPELFKPAISHQASLFGDKYFLTFNTQDKQSGLDHYEVCEGNVKICVVAISPYLILDQSLQQKIYVKAVDRAGNTKIAYLPAQNPPPWYKNIFILAILVVIGAIVLWRKLLK